MIPDLVLKIKIAPNNLKFFQQKQWKARTDRKLFVELVNIILK